MDQLKFPTQDDDDLFDNNPSDQFSIEQQTQQLLNEVFNQTYSPVYNPNTTKKKQQEYQQQKKEVNQIIKEKFKNKKDIYHKVYQNFDYQSVPASFNEFLMKSQERLDKRNYWLLKQRQKKKIQEIKPLKEKPQILRGSKQALIPIYQRCIDLQKEKERQLQKKRGQKFSKQITQAQSHSYHPMINNSKKQRTFEQYIIQKEIWKKQKEDEIQKLRVDQQVKKLSQCTFAPSLVAKYSKSNSRIIPGERVEDRLLRTLDRSLQKKNKK